MRSRKCKLFSEICKICIFIKSPKLVSGWLKFSSMWFLIWNWSKTLDFNKPVSCTDDSVSILEWEVDSTIESIR